MGGEFAAPSLKGGELTAGGSVLGDVWAANLPPPH